MVAAAPVDVLLTYPADGLRLFQSMIPIGLVSIGTVLRNAGYSVKIIDFNHYRSDFRRELGALSPKVVGIGGTTSSRSGSFMTARIVKEILPGIPVVYGGVHASFTAAETLSSIPQIDYIVSGEGEWSFLALCDYLCGRSETSPSAIVGVCWRRDGVTVENRAQRISDLSKIPIPDRDLLGEHYSLDLEFIGGSGDFIMTSRGCPAACNFCAASRMFPGGVRLRPIGAVMDEIEYLRSRRNLSGIKIFDSTFTANREHVEEFCEAVARHSISWECEIRADTVDRDLLTLMKSSGCYYVNIGMETSNAAHLKRIAKGISSRQVLDVLSICRETGIRSKVFFTFGHHQQSFRECLDDVAFIEHNRDRIDFFAVTVGLRIYPGTRLEADCRKNGLLPKKLSWVRRAGSWRNLLLFEPGDVPILFQPQLGSGKLLIVLLILFRKRLICTERFLLKMAGENLRGMVRSALMQVRFTRHRIGRVVRKPVIVRSDAIPAGSGKPFAG